MKKILLITKREYLTQVKKKSFVVLTILAPILILIFGAVIAYMFEANETHYNIAVVDKSEALAPLQSNSSISFQYISSDAEQTTKASLLETDALDGLLVIPKLINKDYSALEKESRLYTNKKISFEVRTKIASEIGALVRKNKIRDLGLNEDQMASLEQNFVLTTENIKSKKAGDSPFVYGVKSGLAGILMYATCMFIIIYGVRVMRSVLEEKNNRVIEIIISSVKPFQLMMGKILGVTLVALTQFVIWIIMILGAALFFNQGGSRGLASTMGGGKIANITEMFSMISHSLLSLNYLLIIFVFIFYFLVGYIFYSSIYAAIGSAVDNETETGQFNVLAILPLMIGLYGGFSIMTNPEGPLAFWLSLIPLTSPVAMIARIPFGVPTWQLLLSMVLLVGSALLMVWVASKIYRVGILMYGNKASFKEIYKWIKS